MNKINMLDAFTEYYDTLFEEWYERDSSSHADPKERYWWDFNQSDFDDEINEKIIADNPVDEDKYREDYLEKCIKEKAKVWFENRYSDFITEIDDKLDFVDSKHIRIYRCIRIAEKDFENFKNKIIESEFIKNYNGLGVYWAFCKNKADSHWASRETFESASKDVLLTAVVPLSSVNLKETFLLNLDSSLGSDEAEIRLVSGEYLHLEKIDDDVVDALVQI